MIIDKEYPATHSMSTSWYIVDEDGNVGFMDFNANGPVSWGTPSCLLACVKPERFCSVSWDKKANFCSFAKGKEQLLSLDYEGLVTALNKVEFVSRCERC